MNRRFGLYAIVCITAFLSCSEDRGKKYDVSLGQWTRESNMYTFYLAADSTLFPDEFEPIQKEPAYHSDSVFYGFVQWGSTGGRTLDDQYHVVKDMDENGHDLFYFDANNNEDLTDDAGPITWIRNSTLEKYPFFDLTATAESGFPMRARIIENGEPYNPQLSDQFARPVLTYGLVTFSAKRGIWIYAADTLRLEAFTMNPCGRFHTGPWEWFILDLNRNGRFEMFPPDLRVLFSDPTFEYDGKTWRAGIDTLGTHISIAEIPPPAEIMAATATASKDTNMIVEPIPAPEFEAVDLEGNRWSWSDLRCRIVVFNFWHSGCIPCRHEMPQLNDLVEKFSGDSIVFLSFTIDAPERAAAFLEQYPFEYHVIAGSSEIIRKYRVTAFPVHMIADRDGNIVYVHLGADRSIGQFLEYRIRALL